jgi:hypothetical protein
MNAYPGVNYAVVFLSAFQQFLFDFLSFIPKLLVAIIIWVLGKYVIGVGVRLLRKTKTTGHHGPWDSIVDSLTNILMPVGKILLFLIILDYLGIGRTVIESLLSGLTFAVAIALGLSFGKAIEGDVKGFVDSMRKEMDK